MKSAHEEKLVQMVQTSLDRDPVDHEKLVACFSDSDKFMAALLIGHLLDNKKKTDQILEVVLNNSKDNRVSIINISRLFVLYPNLLEHYDYDLELNCITCDALPLPNDSVELTYLSIELEAYFGSKDIPHGDLLKAIKRYFLRIHKENNETAQDVELLCQEYLTSSKTRKRIRVPQKYLRDNLQLPLGEIKVIMEANGYAEWKDKSKTVYFYKIEK